MKYSIGVAKKELKNILNQYFQTDEKNGKFLVDKWQTLPLMLLGPAGVGKTQMVESVAREMNLGYVSYSLVHHTRQTLMGLPVIIDFSYEGNQVKDTEYTLSEVIGSVMKQVENGHKTGILLLDEANTAPESIQPMLLSFLQTKVLGSSKLPEGWAIVLCGNPPKSIYNKNAKAWDGALMDRLRVIELDINNKEYLNYVYENSFHPAVKYYLTTCLADAYVCEEGESGLNLITYRTWENLSKALYDYERLGFEVTPVMLNEYIKVDRIVLAFYEIYQYSRLNSEEYANLSEKILEGKIDATIIRNLKNKPVSILYGITNLCFRSLDENAKSLLERHEFLKKFRTKIESADFKIDHFIYDNEVPGEIKNGLKEIWKNCALDGCRKQCTELYNEQINKLVADIEAFVYKEENFLTEIGKIGNVVLARFYVNSIKKSTAWTYVLAGAEHPVLDKLADHVEV